MAIGRCWLGVLALALAAPAGTAASQAIVGRVLDSETGSPLAQVVVSLVGTDLEVVSAALTGTEGRYVLPVRSSGAFFVLVTAPGYASHLSDAMRVRGTELHDHAVALLRLAAPDLGADAGLDPVLHVRPTDVAWLCGPLFDPERHGILIGKVADPGTGRTLVDVWVEARLPPPVAPARRWEARTGADGLYLFCDVPAGATLELRAAGSGLMGRPEPVRITRGSVHRIDLALPLARLGESGQILGRVTDAVSGRGVAGADVVLLEEGRRTLTDAQGYFDLDSVPAGLQALEVQRMGYGQREVAFRVEGGGALGVRVPLSRAAVDLEPIVVRVRSPAWARDMRGFRSRTLHTAGTFFTRSDLERHAAAHLLDLLREVPGLRVQEGGGGGPQFAIRGRSCRPEVVVDRVRRSDARRLASLSAGDLEAVEVYPGAWEAPGLFGIRGDCGAILVWTRTAWS